MARLSQGLIQGLTRPAFGEGLMTGVAGGLSGMGAGRVAEDARMQEAARRQQQGMMAGLTEVQPQGTPVTREQQAEAQQQMEQGFALNQFLRKNGFDDLIGMKPSDAMQEARRRLSAKTSGSGGLNPIGSPITAQDEEGNYYSGVRTTEGIQWEPFSGSPPQAKGKLKPVSSTAGVNLEGRLGLERQQEWKTLRDELVTDLPTLMEERNKVTRGLSLSQVVSTSGVNEAVRGMKDFLGLGDTADAAMLNNAMADFVLSRIKTLGTNPTDTDLRFLNDAEANLRRSKEANIALFEEALKKIDTTIKTREYLLENPEASRDDYVKHATKMQEKIAETIDFSALEQ